jgi:hypothetical protein
MFGQQLYKAIRAHHWTFFKFCQERKPNFASTFKTVSAMSSGSTFGGSKEAAERHLFEIFISVSALTSSEPAAHARGRILAELVWSRQSIHLLNASAFNVSLPPSGSNLYRRLIVHSIFRNHIFFGN